MNVSNNGRAPKVFVAQTPPDNIDISPAIDHGEIRVILTQTSNVRNPQFAVNAALADMHDFDENDFVLPVGDPVICGILCAIADRKTNGNFSVLKWDRQEERYIPIKIKIKS